MPAIKKVKVPASGPAVSDVDGAEQALKAILHRGYFSTRQPLAYQGSDCSCWVTSVSNALVWLFRGSEKVPVVVQRMLHAILSDDGVGGDSNQDWQYMLEAAAKRCKLDLKNAVGKEVDASFMREIDFSSSVAIVDVDSGGHSLLILERHGDWYAGFDPSWSTVRPHKKLPDHRAGYFDCRPSVRSQSNGCINFIVHQDHLLPKKLGKEKRFATGATGYRNVSVLTVK